MLADTPAPSRHVAGAPPSARLSLLVSVALALVTPGLLAVVLLEAQPATPTRPTTASLGPPRLVLPPRDALARVAVPDAHGIRVGGPGGDPGPSPAPEGDVEGGAAGGVAGAAVIVLAAVALAAVFAIALRTHVRSAPSRDRDLTPPRRGLPG